MNRYAAVLAIALLGATNAMGQRHELAPIADPASVAWRDVASMTVIVPDCQAWETDAMVIGCAPVARPPQVCIFAPPAMRVFEILGAALAATGAAAPPPSPYAKATLLMRLRGGGKLEAEIPLYPSLEKGGGSEIWARYGARRIRLDRAAWDAISALARSGQCVQQPRRWEGIE